MKTVLVVAAHADDETLGCGGTIARHVEEGDVVHLVLMADGVHSRTESSKADYVRRIEASKRAQSILGISFLQSLELPDNKMDSVPLLEIVQRLEPILEEIQPSVVYTHHHGDLNIDHRLTQAAVMTACRPVPGSSVREIYGFEVLSSTEWATQQSSSFLPDYYVDITQQLLTKLDALEAYAEEMRNPPHSRSMAHVEVLAHHRGYSVGVDAAEAFEVYRIIR
jgi:N-acetylglucosamine malate deacetylase 1